jgi:hypothetical protein
VVLPALFEILGSRIEHSRALHKEVPAIAPMSEETPPPLAPAESPKSEPPPQIVGGGRN